MGRSVTLPSYRALDAVVEIEVGSDPELADELAEILADLITPDADPTVRLCVERAADGTWRVGWQGESALAPLDRSSVAQAVVNAISDRAGAGAVATCSVVHAAAFELDGAAVLCVGPSGAGKSTLVAAAVLAGAGFLADEIGAIDPEGLVRPFPRPIGLRAGGAELLGIATTSGAPDQRTFLRAGAVGWLSVSAPLACIALLDRRAGPAATTEVAPAHALFAAAGQSIGGPGGSRGTRSTEAFRRLEALVRRTPTVALGYDRPVDGVHALRRAVLRAPAARSSDPDRHNSG